MAALLEARAKDDTPLYPTAVVLMPRRSTKTTAIWATLLGRCYARPGHKVITTAQDGLRARRRFREVMRVLDAGGFAARGLGRLYLSNGEERIEWANGSSMWVVPPEPGAFRSEAADDVLFDEAGELSIDESENLVAGALPLMDTRPMGQVIITGTPSPVRAGLFWDTLEHGRTRTKGVGILDYSIRDDEPSVLFPDGEDAEPQLNRPLLQRVHPGIGTLTTLRKIEERFSKMTLVKFEMEYLCRFPFDQSVSAINPTRWKTAGSTDALPVRPDRVGLAFDVAPDGSAAALAAAWRDDTGRAHLELLAYRPGVTWLPAVAKIAATKHRTAIAYDVIGANTNPADLMHRLRVRLAGQNLKAMQGAAQRIVAELDDAQLVHYRQKDLDLAVDGANWRNVNEGGRLFGRKASAHDVAPLVAASIALWHFDQVAGNRRSLTITTSGRKP